MSSKLDPKKTLFIKEKKWKEAGQLSIFLGMSTLVVTTFIAFVVNVGLFVKAKINLQNAVDSAAYAGAAVQARQLTNMGYLNWELRNNYKEWLFKYYVFGNIGLDAIENDTNIDTGSEPTPGCTAPNAPGGSIQLNPGLGMNFRLRQFRGSDCRYYNASVFDRFNVPSVCVHFGSNNNICELVTQPGLPRFNTVGLPSISEQHESLLNSIVSTKAADCSNRTNINLGTTVLWTYGTGNANIFPGIPEIASERVGAWVQALELGLRMRNLERIMNQPPQDFICRGGSGCTNAQELDANDNPLPFLERTSKAFWTGYRNLSGGSKKGSDQRDFASTFRLREIPPNVVDINENSLSGLLINTDSTANFQKYYVDLKVMPVNYALFYTSFYPYSDEFRASSGIPAEATCGGTKTAMPVPGYILGFSKNPKVPTYYAVEGQAEFMGLFFPFLKDDGITLKTYASAKPFGGRIGPALFDAGSDDENKQFIETRAIKKVSANYISALETAGLPQSSTPDFAETIVKGGYPIPTDPDFWIPVVGSATVGGIPSVSGTTGFGIPNIIYDFDNYSEISDLGVGASNSAGELDNVANDTQAYRTPTLEFNYGLYRKSQFRKFAANKVGGGGAIFSNQQVLQSIFNVRRATRYEALNYMVPIIDDTGNNILGIDTNTYVQLIPQPVAADPSTRLYRLFAPLYGTGTLFASPAAVINIVNNYINANQASIEKYLDTIKTIADGMRNFATRGGDSYVTAANDLYPQDGNLDRDDPDFCANLPLAAKVYKFLNTAEKGCGIPPLSSKVAEYFTNPPGGNTQFPYFYISTIKPPNFDQKQLLTGYRPGPRQGAEPDGAIGSPFTGSTLLAKRNSYSVKFIPIKKVLQGEEPYDKNIFLDPASDSPTYPNVSGEFSGSLPMLNPIDSEELRAYRGLLSF